MNVINTKVHGVMDYLLGAMLMASPWLFGFYRGGLESSVPMLIGAGTLLYSLITNYELGIANAISMKTHLILDVISGLFLIASPWLLGFHNTVYLPHVVIGVLEIVVVAFSSSVAYQHHNHHQLGM